MPDNPLNPPESPPAKPTIPEGLATKLGKYGALAALIVAVIVEFTDIHLDNDTKDILVGALGLILTTMLGRYAQATAIYRDKPSPAQQQDELVVGPEDEVIFPEDEATKPPAEEDLTEDYPGERPPEPPPVGGVGGKIGDETKEDPFR